MARINTLNEFYKKKFGSKVFKVSLDAGFGCPNKDGSKGYGGCIFCNGTPFVGDVKDDLLVQFEKVKALMHTKWKDAKYIVYLEAGSNTYADVSHLKEVYEPLILLDGVVGINIGTRCDCLSEEILDYLEDLNKRTYVTVELGLQSSFDKTLEFLNRGHTREDFANAVKKLKERDIDVVVHIINGLPGETKDMMLETINFINSLSADGIKIHMLYIEKGMPLEKIYREKKFKLLSCEEYIDIVISQLEILKPDIVVHRLTSGPDRDKLIAPEWLVHKYYILNTINKLLEEKDTYQGKYYFKE